MIIYVVNWCCMGLFGLGVVCCSWKFMNEIIEICLNFSGYYQKMFYPCYIDIGKAARELFTKGYS